MRLLFYVSLQIVTSYFLAHRVPVWILP